MITHYYSLHIPTETLTKHKWDEYALEAAGYDPKKYNGAGISLKEALVLVNKWNRSSFSSYRYWID